MWYFILYYIAANYDNLVFYQNSINIELVISIQNFSFHFHHHCSNQTEYNSPVWRFRFSSNSTKKCIYREILRTTNQFLWSHVMTFFIPQVALPLNQAKPIRALWFVQKDTMYFTVLLLGFVSRTSWGVDKMKSLLVSLMLVWCADSQLRGRKGKT